MVHEIHLGRVAVSVEGRVRLVTLTVTTGLKIMAVGEAVPKTAELLCESVVPVLAEE